MGVVVGIGIGYFLDQKEKTYASQALIGSNYVSAYTMVELVKLSPSLQNSVAEGLNSLSVKTPKAIIVDKSDSIGIKKANIIKATVYLNSLVHVKPIWKQLLVHLNSQPISQKVITSSGIENGKEKTFFLLSEPTIPLTPVMNTRACYLAGVLGGLFASLCLAFLVSLGNGQNRS